MKTQLHFRKQLVLATLSFNIFLIGLNSVSAQTWTQLGTTFIGPANTEFATSVSISADGNTTAYGLPAGGPSTGNRVQVFSYNGSSWTQKGNTIVSSSRGGESISLSADGNRVCIGSPQSGIAATNAGLVQVYSFNGTAWEQLGSNFLGGAIGDFFGYRVVISSDGNTFAASAIYDDYNGVSDAGSVVVFTYNGTDWVQKGPSIYGTSDRRVGKSLDMDATGNNIILGGGTIISGGFINGAVRMFSFDGTNWEQKGQEFIGNNYDDLGHSTTMSADGNIIAFGTNSNYNIGYVKAFEYNNSSGWVQLGDDMIGESIGDRFGKTISINANGNILAIGAPEVNVDGLQEAGNVIVNQLVGTSWNQVGQVVSGDGALNRLGSALALSSDSNTYVVAELPALGTAFVYRSDIPLSINKSEFFDMSIFPNPSKGNFSVNFGRQYETINIKIANALGQVVFSKTYNSVKRIEDFVLTNPGIYLINVNTGDGASETLKLVIN
jgi:hypothetical protein